MKVEVGDKTLGQAREYDFLAVIELQNTHEIKLN